MKFKIAFSFLFLSLAMTNNLLAQEVKIEIIGEVFDDAGKNPIPFATIIVKESVSEKKIAGAITDVQGRFKVISDKTSVFLEVSFMGFVTRNLRDLVVKNGLVNIGVIHLKEDSQALDEVEIRAEKSTTEFKLDKRAVP